MVSSREGQKEREEETRDSHRNGKRVEGLVLSAEALIFTLSILTFARKGGKGLLLFGVDSVLKVFQTRPWLFRLDPRFSWIGCSLWNRAPFP